MIRDWIGELQKRGHLIKDIAKESGVPQQTLTKYVRGKLPLTSKSKHYEAIRNVNRKLAARELRGKELTPQQADTHKRTYFHREAPPKEGKVPTVRMVKAIKARDVVAAGTGEFHQLTIVGLFYNCETEEYKQQRGWSRAHIYKDYERDLEEAIQDAKTTIGMPVGHYGKAAYWMLDFIMEQNYVTTREEKRDETSKV